VCASMPSELCGAWTLFVFNWWCRWVGRCQAVGSMDQHMCVCVWCVWWWFRNLGATGGKTACKGMIDADITTVCIQALEEVGSSQGMECCRG